MKVASALRRVIQSQVVEILIPAGAPRTKFQFPDEQNLRYVHFMGFVTYLADIVPLSILSGAALPTLAQLQDIFVTWQAYDAENFSWQTPAVAYANLGTAATVQQFSPRVFAGQKVNFPKSYIELLTPALFPAETSFFIEVFYKPMTHDEMLRAKSSFHKRK